jgi:hypothetical protein
VKLVRRPTGKRDGPIRLRELKEALDAEGVQPGEQFTVSRIDVPGDGLGPFVKDSDTSRQAALNNYPRTGSQRYRVVEYLRQTPSTRDELEVALGLCSSTIHPRVWELVKGGWIWETPQTRLTRLGCEAHVLALTEKGEAYEVTE